MSYGNYLNRIYLLKNDSPYAGYSMPWLFMMKNSSALNCA